MIYFTSDLHLGHKNVLKLCNRPFDSIEEMDACLIANWNERVTNNDTVYILGDLMFRNTVPPEEYLSQLKGKKHLIRGNHDRDWMKKVDISKYFVSNENLSFISDGKHRITVCHYPMMSWPHMSTTGYMVFGHIHQNTDSVYWPIIEKSELMLNAGVDINGFKPVTFDEMVKNNKKHKIRTRFHREIYDDEAPYDKKFSLIEKLEELLNKNIWDDETEKYIKSIIIEFEKSLKCERYSHHGYLPSFLQEEKILPKGEPIKCEKTYIRHFSHRKGEKMSSTNENLKEIKAEIKSIKRDILKDLQNSDVESLEENFFALMDCHDRMRNHFKESISQLNSENVETRVIE